MDYLELVDMNLYKRIDKCFINRKDLTKAEVFAIYEDGSREVIWTFNPGKHDFESREFIGKTKIAAVFHCDRKFISRNFHGVL